jgi:Ca2+-binding RTX toxin-like protein
LQSFFELLQSYETTFLHKDCCNRQYLCFIGDRKFVIIKSKNLVIGGIHFMSTIYIKAGQTVTESILLDEFASLKVAGKLVTDASQPAVLTQNEFNKIKVKDGGVIDGGETAIQIEGVKTSIYNDGTIEGDLNAINIANGDVASAEITNTGTITSASRAINIGAVGGVVYNKGFITTTADPRNGTIYGDVTAQNVFIYNYSDGIIDVGAGNNGDAISLELDANVNGTIVNEGLIQGRGMPDGAPDNKTNLASAVRLYWVSAAGAKISVFNGDIKNSGTLAAQNGATIIIENQTKLNGWIDNSGTIEGGAISGGKLAIDVSKAADSVKIRNSGVINGDVRLSAGDDLFDGHNGEINGSVSAGDGNDRVIGGTSNDILVGDAGYDTIKGKTGNDILNGGSGNDLLKGGRGDDFLDGGSGVDTLTGGKGKDTFFFADFGGTPTTAPNGISVINQPDILTDFKIGTDKLVFDSIDVGLAGGLKFQKGVTSQLSGDRNLLVLEDGFANAATAAKAIADNDALTADVGAFVYFNTTLGIARFVFSQDLGDGGTISVLGNLSNITNAADLSQFSDRDFGFTALT